jgi:3-(3-hydroxy-phenyl)propionate hydroxylase
MSGFDCDLLVVGLGPVGDVLAGLAKLHGLSVIAIDKETAVHPLPRAAVFDHEIMRIFQMLGVAENIRRHCRVADRYQFLTADGDVLLDFELAPIQPQSGWAESYALHQPAVEAALQARIAALGVDIRRGVGFQSLTQDDDGVTADVEGAGGASQIRARYMVGCDGARSSVREALGVDLFDFGFDEPWLVLDTICQEPDGLPMTIRQICDPKRPVTYMPMAAPRFRWEFMIKPGEAPSDMLEDAAIDALLAPWISADRVRVERKAVYRFHALVARTWRKGRVLLCGDAAHQMPPFAGQGMCSGLRDACNLAWKLGAVIGGQASEGILESYQAEREPHVRAIIETAIAMGRTVCILDEEAAAARNAGMLAQRAGGAQNISIRYPDLHGGLFMPTPPAGALFPQAMRGEERLDAVLALGASLIGRHLPEGLAPSVHRLNLEDPQLAPFAEALEVWLKAQGAASVLVRPDRHVFGTGDPEALLQAWEATLAGVATPQETCLDTLSSITASG